jgi:biotin synthase
MDNYKVFLCAICNCESGTCSEDCKFCTQSIKYKAKINRYKFKNIENIVDEAKIAYKNKAIGFCLVTAGLGLTDKRIEFVSAAAHAIKKEVPNINIIGCSGIANKEQLKQIKDAGVNKYNHNLESSKEFYNEICTTHSWNQRYETCLNTKEVGLDLCTGGIFGMGESFENRISMLKSIKELKPKSMPINFFHPNEALPIKINTLNKQEALDMIRYIREYLGEDIVLMVAGGRENILKNDQYKIFEYGANAIVIGNYLTTRGKIASKDLEELEKLNINIAKYCKE